MNPKLMKRVIIDCDPGNGIAGANIDDGLALALAIASPEISIELITTVSGNTPSDIGYSIAYALMKELGLSIPVFRGASQALVELSTPWREKLDYSIEKNGFKKFWSGVTRPKLISNTAPLAANKIGELICNNPGQITLIAIAPLTNIAHTIQLYPEIVNTVKEIVIMGGVFDVEGYIKDTNFGLDPEAAHVVLTSGANITLVPMDVTTQTMVTHADLDRIAEIGTPLCDYLEQTIRPWIHYSMQTRSLPGCWIHDVLTIAYLIDKQIVTSQESYVDVALEGGLTRGTSWCYNPQKLRLNVGIPVPKGKPINLLKSVDNDRLISILYTTLKQYK